MALEGALAEFFPMAKVDLIIRFDEFGTGALNDTAPKKPAHKIDGVKDPARAPLTVKKDATAPEGVSRWVIGVTTPAGRGAGQDQTASKDNLTHIVRGVRPRKAEWLQNGFRDADTLDLEIRYADLPLDPRVIRSCAVEFFLGTVPGAAFAKSVRNFLDGDVPYVIPDKWTDARGVQRTNLRFQGWVDSWEIEYGDSDEPCVRLKCTDNTRLLVKQHGATRQVVDGTKPLDQAIAQYLANYPQFEGLTVEYRPTDADVPVLNKILAGSAMRPKLGPPAAKGGGAAGGEGFTVWDYITDVCGAIGHNVRLDGTTVIIQRVRDALTETRSEDPYTQRDLTSGPYPYRTFIFGKNVKSAKLSRQYARKEPANIECRAYNPARKNIMVARFPEKSDLANPLVSVLPGDGKSEQRWTVVRVPGIYSSQADLKKFAEDYYFAFNKQEVEIEVETADIASFGGGNEDPDVLDMKVGDPVEVLIDQSHNHSTFEQTELQVNAAGLAQKRLVELGFDEKLAQAYATAKAQANLLTIFRARQIKTSFDAEQGVSFNFTMHNFIQKRNEPRT